MDVDLKNLLGGRCIIRHEVKESLRIYLFLQIYVVAEDLGGALAQGVRVVKPQGEFV